MTKPRNRNRSQVLITTLCTLGALTALPTQAVAKTPGLPLGGSDATVGAPAHIENLSLFPIYRDTAAAVETKIVSFDAALEVGQVIVREVGNKSTPTPRQAQSYRQNIQQNVQQQTGGGARVGTLVIENRGDTPVLVLAGTVVKGGKQDRQIGQDFVIGPHKVADVNAFCVEQGRWNGQRDGRATGGNFRSTKMLATQKVRAAGQYKGDQSEVWSEVSEVNRKNKKHAASGTLMASLDDKKIGAARERIATKASVFLRGLAGWKQVVGVAYAVNGEVRAARWFVGHALFDQNSETLLNTAAVEAITERGEMGAKAKQPTNVGVQQFVEKLRRAQVKAERKTKSLNTNRYRENEAGYSAETVVPAGDKELQISIDYLAK